MVDLGIANNKGEFMARTNRKKKRDQMIEEPFDADIAPSYDGDEKKEYKMQGKVSMMDEFYTLYRRWLKNE